MAVLDKMFLAKDVLLLDGGLGTTLEDQYGVKFSSRTPLWSSHMLLQSPDILFDVQKRFADAGADILLTATYQASIKGFKNTITDDHPDGIDEVQAKALMRKAVAISREAFGGRPGMVTLSLGAYGATMVPGQEYSGAYDLDEQGLVDFHLSRLQTFTDSPEWDDVDCLAFETLPRINEIRAVRRVMQDLCESDKVKPYWISCVFPDGDRLPDGSTIEEVVSQMLRSPGTSPFAIGLNCTKIQRLVALVREFEVAGANLNLALPRLVLYPDGAGDMVYDTSKQEWVGDQNQNVPWDMHMYHVAQDVLSRGRWDGLIVGGCCKTTPDHIGSLRARFDARVHKA